MVGTKLVKLILVMKMTNEFEKRQVIDRIQLELSQILSELKCFGILISTADLQDLESLEGLGIYLQRTANRVEESKNLLNEIY